MTCEKCGHKEVLHYQSGPEASISRSCPMCDNISLMSKEESIKVTEKQYEYIDKFLINQIERFNKISLIFWLLEYRKELVSKFFDGSPLIKLRNS